MCVEITLRSVVVSLNLRHTSLGISATQFDYWLVSQLNIKDLLAPKPTTKIYDNFQCSVGYSEES